MKDRTDTERLDWLHRLINTDDGILEMDAIALKAQDCTLRKAIDAAMEETK